MHPKTTTSKVPLHFDRHIVCLLMCSYNRNGNFNW